METARKHGVVMLPHYSTHQQQIGYHVFQAVQYVHHISDRNQAEGEIVIKEMVTNDIYYCR
jgi:hypothetical protein